MQHNGSMLLIVEDHPIYLDLARSAAQVAGWRPVHVTAHVRDAQAVARACPPNLVLLDYRLESGAAVEFARWMRATGGYERTLCCAWTAAPEDVPLHEFDAVLLKPCAPPDEARAMLIAQISMLLDQRMTLNCPRVGNAPAPSVREHAFWKRLLSWFR